MGAVMNSAEVTIPRYVDDQRHVTSFMSSYLKTNFGEAELFTGTHGNRERKIQYFFKKLRAMYCHIYSTTLAKPLVKVKRDQMGRKE